MTQTAATAIGYARVSTSKQADNGHSLDLQQKALRAEAERHGWSIETVTEEGSARSIAKRPVLQETLRRLAAGEASVLIVHRLDRLGRSLKDVLAVVEMSSKQGWSIVFVEQGIDSSTSTGRLTLGLLGSVAQYENELRSERIKEGLAEARAKGVRLGRPQELNAETFSYVKHLRSTGLSLERIADRLNAEEVLSARGSRWYAASVSQVLRSRAA